MLYNICCVIQHFQRSKIVYVTMTKIKESVNVVMLSSYLLSSNVYLIQLNFIDVPTTLHD